MVPDFHGSHKSEESLGSDYCHSSSMEGPTLVPCSAGDAIRLPSTVTLLIESIPTDVRSTDLNWPYSISLGKDWV